MARHPLGWNSVTFILTLLLLDIACLKVKYKITTLSKITTWTYCKYKLDCVDIYSLLAVLD